MDDDINSQNMIIFNNGNDEEICNNSDDDNDEKNLSLDYNNNSKNSKQEISTIFNNIAVKIVDIKGKESKLIAIETKLVLENIMK